ncbi:HAMP domain-containing sensor histidine kinase [Mesorhizobium sp. 1M-11]|uniref:ATP-binding protein n=1 Tax=Mesorhizobium sp. 1M-11 TaxID=1529006 RepID=UPI0006C738F4
MKWRPPLSLVVLAILSTVMVLPLAGLAGYRLLEAAPHSALIAGAIVLGVTLVIGFVFVRVITRPMYELMERTARIAAGDAEAIRPLSHHGTQEMAELSDAFLDMARKLQARSDTIRTFATHVSHELKSPLTSIQGAAELLRDAGEEMDAATRARFQNNIVADAERMNQLVRRLIELARAESAGTAAETTSLAEALAGFAVSGEGAPSADAEPPVPGTASPAVVVEAGADLRFRMSGENAAILFSNLADNSARHGASRFVVSARQEDGVVVIVASDDGAGVSPDNRARIFSPFFTTRRETGGTGMGLSIVAALVKAHEGGIRLVDGEGGATFEIEIPAG